MFKQTYENKNTKHTQTKTHIYIYETQKTQLHIYIDKNIKLITNKQEHT